MQEAPLFLGSNPIRTASGIVQGEYVTLEGERFYRIANYDAMAPFFISLVSPHDHWMFLWSSGGLTAGRQNAENALFPYYTEDKLRDQADSTGPRTILRVTRNGKRFLWEPFSRSSAASYRIRRNLYKNVTGNKILFEEENEDLELRFRYAWKLSDRFGFIKHSTLENRGDGAVTVEILDGLENLLPRGLGEDFQNSYSCLGDAYKQSDLDEESGLGLYALSSVPGDSPEPAEALRTSVAWSSRPASETRLLSSLQLEAFRRGQDVSAETRICGRRGAFFIAWHCELPARGAQDWLIVADVDYGPREVAALRAFLTGTADIAGEVLDDAEAGTERLKRIVARADGLQRSEDELGAAHHFANVLFNVMRGGIFESGYDIEADDLRGYLASFNRPLAEHHAALLSDLPAQIKVHELRGRVDACGDPDLSRLVHEYLPISFSRRHGDPSRPWNKFSINIRNPDGSKLLDYQGNWRDIFQNWEALCLSFPEFFDSVIAKFVDSSTADGYNPYRVTKHGYDWEVPDPDEPWSHFGYWGDHQLVYLLRLLEWSQHHRPGELRRLLHEARFVYADVPYDIKPYAELLADPRDSLSYNNARAAAIAKRVAAIGHDGQLLPGAGGAPFRANLTEKLLVPLLAKMANFVPGAGFWMNTQRPEWNDANNALAGYGASMVTLYHARRYVSFCLELFATLDEEVFLSADVNAWLETTTKALTGHRAMLAASATDQDRKALLDALGAGAERYRAKLYAEGLDAESAPVRREAILAFLRDCLDYFDHSIAFNRRDDGLYHAYNVLEISDHGIGIDRLTVMLEGQVAVLGSGALSSSEALAIAGALRESPLYREDQHSYLLYPDKRLPGFLEKNRVPRDVAESIPLLRQLLAAGNTAVIEPDCDGELYFNSRFRNIRDLDAALERLAVQGYGDLVASDTPKLRQLFDTVFGHQRFTGRSGTFYGYEGLGCIYWHQVSKLLLAVQECCLSAGTDDPAFEGLAAAYYDVRAGIGFNKSPDVYGAFPTDPYSHTPGFAGARQPGMTGQVKEEVITRLGELGLSVRDGSITFAPLLLRRSEFLCAPQTFDYFDVAGDARRLELDAGTLAFTYCQVPVVYHLGDSPAVRLQLADGSKAAGDGLTINRSLSAAVFRRSGDVQRIDVTLSPHLP